MGLFSWLTPSFALFSARPNTVDARTRLDRTIEALAAVTGEPEPRVEYHLATRGNTTLVQTARPSCPEADPLGRWTLHLPLSPQQRVQIRRHHERITAIRQGFPELPVPEPLFLGELEGQVVACERRLPGVTAPQLSGDADAMARMFGDVARHLGGLVQREAAPLDVLEFEKLFASRFEIVARHAGFDATVEAGLRDVGLSGDEVAGIMGENWLRFFDENFVPATGNLAEPPQG